MTEKQFDAHPEVIKVFKLKEEQRQAAKEYYRKILFDPHRPVDSGIPFDPVAFRFTSLIQYHTEYFRPNMRNVSYGILWTVLPMFAMFHLFKWDSERKEREIRNGNVAYKDRKWKLLL